MRKEVAALVLRLKRGHGHLSITDPKPFCLKKLGLTATKCDHRLVRICSFDEEDSPQAGAQRGSNLIFRYQARAPRTPIHTGIRTKVLDRFTTEMAFAAKAQGRRHIRLTMIPLTTVDLRPVIENERGVYVAGPAPVQVSSFSEPLLVIEALLGHSAL